MYKMRGAVFLWKSRRQMMVAPQELPAHFNERYREASMTCMRLLRRWQTVSQNES